MKTLNYNAVLQDFQYKPNWSYGAYERDGGWWIRVLMLVENSYSPWRRWEIKPHPEEEIWFNDIARMPMRQTFIGYSPSREMIEVVGNYPIPDCFLPGDDEQFITWMVYTIKGMEEHESDEWIRYKGKLIRDPHAS